MGGPQESFRLVLGFAFSSRRVAGKLNKAGGRVAHLSEYSVKHCSSVADGFVGRPTAADGLAWKRSPKSLRCYWVSFSFLLPQSLFLSPFLKGQLKDFKQYQNINSTVSATDKPDVSWHTPCPCRWYANYATHANISIKISCSLPLLNRWPSVSIT